ncbi:unnamed protein product [Ambrosiozyma monospora]|uniref:Unnamed protein product n=1 Tax=Ambrosiozyma monospora TaxID=43982 RepID=A0ACB5TKU9_AMBMO|nr:unnamed protein product [Ambrosiozyma monospora]
MDMHGKLSNGTIIKTLIDVAEDIKDNVFVCVENLEEATSCFSYPSGPITVEKSIDSTPNTNTNTQLIHKMSSLQSLIASMFKDSPPGNNITFVNDIKTILANDNSSKIIAENLAQCTLNNDFKLVKLSKDEFGVISKYNKSGLKFYDPLSKLTFDYDFNKLKVIDVEEGEDSSLDSAQISKLNEQLAEYASLHYPTFYKSLVVPDQDDSDIVYLIIVDENLNDANYYNGKYITTKTEMLF